MKNTIPVLLSSAAAAAMFTMPSPTARAAVSEQTLKNLNAAYQGESNASNRYAAFARRADTEGYPQVAKLFRAALAAEKEHAKLYQEALDDLGRNAPVDYYVCQVCGMTLTELPAKKCPSCRKSRDEYKKVG